jgi:hypothetical protein
MLHCIPVLEGQPLLAPLEDVLPLSHLLAPVDGAKEAIMQVSGACWQQRCRVAAGRAARL